LLGCALARLVNATINIRHPYVKHGDDAFNGRTLDEKVVNPFLQDQMIPCSKGPYLATFRRSIKFILETREGLRDKAGYDAFLQYIQAFESADEEETRELVLYLVISFVKLREAAHIPLARIARLSLEQYASLIDGLLATSSGGLVPLLLAVAMFKTLRNCFQTGWTIEWQGINVADKASGAGGDITIRTDERVLLAVEVTERPIARARLVSTFNTKISPNGIEDYLFLFTDKTPDPEARIAAMQYFAQGHAVDFLPVKPWLVNVLGTVGADCRALFTNEFLALLDGRNVPATVKIAWNKLIKDLLTAPR